MSPFWIASTVLAWLAIVVLALAVVGLLRRVDRLRARLDLLDPEAVDDGPALGLEVAPQRLVAMDGTRVSLGGEREHPTLVMFVQPDCGTCTALAQRLPALPDADTLLVMRGDRAAALRELGADGPVPVVLQGVFPEGYEPSQWTPSVLALSPDGHVAAIGHPTRPEHLEQMAAAARHAEWSTPDAVREHEWGVSAPYWEGEESGPEPQAPG